MTSNDQGVPSSYTYQEYALLLRSLGHVKGAPGPVKNSARRVNGQIDRQDDYTDYCAEQAEWTVDNMPEIMYALQRPPGWLTPSDLNPPPKKTYRIYGEFLDDVPILPDHISSQLEGHRYEILCRYDPRIRFEEIAKRMAPQFRPSSLLPDGRYRTSTGQMARNRFRHASNVLGWVSKGGNYAQTKQELEDKLRAVGVNPSITNSTRGITWGLINPANGPNSARVPITGAHARETNSSVEVPTPADRRAANAQYAALRASLGLTTGIPGVQSAAAIQPAPSWTPFATAPTASTTPAISYEASSEGDFFGLRQEDQEQAQASETGDHRRHKRRSRRLTFTSSVGEDEEHFRSKRLRKQPENFLDEVFDTGPRDAGTPCPIGAELLVETESVRGLHPDDCATCEVINPLKCLFHYLEDTILPTPYTGRQ